jgi:hypothetical protein
MVATMARLSPPYIRSTHPTLQLLLLVVFLLKNVYAVVPPTWGNHERNFRRRFADQYFCGFNNTEVQNDCEGPPGTCVYPLPFDGPDTCTSYVTCELLGRWDGKRLARAHFVRCISPDDEFSPITRQCERKGAPGTCGETNGYYWFHHNLASRSDVSE